MVSTLIFVLVAVALFFAAYFAKRRFGLLGLALATGSLLSGIWEYEAGLMAGALGISPTIVSVIILLLPAFVLLFHGYTYKTFVGRIIGAILFTFITMAFLVELLGQIMDLGGLGLNLYNWFLGNKSLVIGSGLIVAVIDLFLTKPISNAKKR